MRVDGAGAASIDVMLILNNDGKMILAGGRRGWNFPPTPTEFHLTIDKDAPLQLHGNAFNNLFLIAVADEIQARLEKASTLKFELPWGSFDAHVGGLDKAFATLKSCEVGKGNMPH